MALKYFNEIELKNSIAVNPNCVMLVIEHSRAPKIILTDGTYYFVEGSYLETVARLNERD
jgi:hypothetical protein